MLRPFLSRDVMSRDQIARSSTEEPRRRAARSELFVQLLHLLPHRFLAQRCLVDVRTAVDVAVPFGADLLGRDVRVHRGEACGHLVHRSMKGKLYLGKSEWGGAVFFFYTGGRGRVGARG